MATVQLSDAQVAEGSVTHWIDRLKEGEKDAAHPLWEAYFGRLVGLARNRLRGHSRQIADEEDVALSAFDSFCRGAERGRFARLADRNDLWTILAIITLRKASDLVHYQMRKKRGGQSGREQERNLREILSREPTPEMVAQVAEGFRRLMDRLKEDDDAELLSIALWRMEGVSNQQIATRLDCALRTVERKLNMIRKLWETEG